MRIFTSFELSKKLWENGCKLESEYMYIDNEKVAVPISDLDENFFANETIKSYFQYDILWDICVKYAKEFFGIYSNYQIYTLHKFDYTGYDTIAREIVIMCQNKASIEHIEKYIWHNCLFNKEQK